MGKEYTFSFTRTKVERCSVTIPYNSMNENDMWDSIKDEDYPINVDDVETISYDLDNVEVEGGDDPPVMPTPLTR